MAPVHPFPEPSSLPRQGVGTLRGLGFSRPKVAALHALVEEAAGDGLTREDGRELSNAAVVQRLTHLAASGVAPQNTLSCAPWGVWTCFPGTTSCLQIPAGLSVASDHHSYLGSGARAALSSRSQRTPDGGGRRGDPLVQIPGCAEFRLWHGGWRRERRCAA